MNKQKYRIPTAKIEQRFSILRTILALTLAILIAFVLIYLISTQPAQDMYTLILGPFTNKMRLISLLIKWIPLVFTGVAVCMLFSIGQANLAAEGAFFAGAVCATPVALLEGIPPVLHFILCAIVAALAGAIITGIPAVMNTKFGVLTVVSSLMMNYVAQFFGLFLILNYFKDPGAGFDASYKFMESAKLGNLVPKTQLHYGIVLAVLLIVVASYVLHSTTYGLKIRLIGNNPRFSKFEGIGVPSMMISAQLLGGAIAGMGGAVEILGTSQRFVYAGLTGHGWDGIMLAVLAGNNPKYIAPAALFLAYLRTSADVLNRTSDVPVEVITIVQAIIIALVAAERLLARYKTKAIQKNSQLPERPAETKEVRG